MSFTVRAASFGIVALALAQTVAAQSDPALRAPAPGSARGGEPFNPASLVFASPPPVTVKDGFTYAVLGDISERGPVTQLPLPEFEKVLSIVRGADFSLANQEGTAFSVTTKKFAVNDQGAMATSDTGFAWDIKNMGVRMIGAANNHSVDYGPDALMEDLRLAREAGLPYAGAGANLREARAATLLVTPKGRVTVVDAAGTYKENFGAGDGRGALADRPGISLARTTVFEQVTAPEMTLLKQLAAMREPTSAAATNPGLPQQLDLLDQLYKLGDKPGYSYRLNQFDLHDIMQAVHIGRQNSDFTVFMIHAHQSATGDDDSYEVPGDYLIQLFHSVVDAGADVVAGTGNHLFRGIEIYKGKVIFYGLASFVFTGAPAGLNAGQEPRLLKDPNEPRTPAVSPGDKSSRVVAGSAKPLTMWESIFATTTWEGGKLKEVKIYPIDLNAAGTKPKGVPAFASHELAMKILGEVKRDSEAYGTKVQIEGDVGIIRP